MVTIKHTRESIAELEQEREQFKQQRDELIEDIQAHRDLLKEFSKFIDHKLYIHPGNCTYLSYRNELDQLGICKEREWMAYEYEIKSGQKVFIENTNGHLYKATVININEYREPSMRVSIQVDGIEDIVFTGLENIKIMEDK